MYAIGLAKALVGITNAFLLLGNTYSTDVRLISFLAEDGFAGVDDLYGTLLHCGIYD
jgi:hypothetical protein